MIIIDKLRQHPNSIKLFLAIFYLVGVLAIYIPYTSDFFISLTPLALLMSFGFLMLFHPKFDANTIGVFALIFVLGFFIEERGVNTGLIFGNYSYGDTLGLKISETPLMMGINWILMIYLTASVVEKYKINPVFKIIAASTIMIVYDLVLEQVAPNMNMWSWQDGEIPIRNYLAWFAIAVVFHSILKIRKVETRNKLASTLLLCQMLFFVALLFK